MNSAEVRSLSADSIVTYRFFAKLRDKKRLDQVKAYLASIPPERRSAVAKRALALHLGRRAGRGPSTYLATTSAAITNSPTNGPDEIAQLGRVGSPAA
jgi:hypothetical protein